MAELMPTHEQLRALANEVESIDAGKDAELAELRQQLEEAGQVRDELRVKLDEANEAIVFHRDRYTQLAYMTKPANPYASLLPYLEAIDDAARTLNHPNHPELTRLTARQLRELLDLIPTESDGTEAAEPTDPFAGIVGDPVERSDGSFYLLINKEDPDSRQIRWVGLDVKKPRHWMLPLSSQFVRWLEDFPAPEPEAIPLEKVEVLGMVADTSSILWEVLGAEELDGVTTLACREYCGTFVKNIALDDTELVDHYAHAPQLAELFEKEEG